eukprot:EG_transcript_5117
MAAMAITRLDGVCIEGHHLSVTLAKRDKDKGIANKPCANLYVANLPTKFEEVDLQAIFSTFGPIHSCRILRYQDTGLSKGTALIRFERLEDATAAKEALHCCSVGKAALPLEVKYAESKEDRLLRRDESGKAVPARPAEEDGTDDLATLRTYVAGVVEHYNSQWDHAVHRAPAPPSPNAPAVPPPSADCAPLPSPDGAMDRITPPSSCTSHVSHPGSSCGYEDVDGDRPEKRAPPSQDRPPSPPPSRLNPLAAPYVPRAGARDRTRLELTILESLADRLVRMDAAQLAQLSTLLSV